MNRINPFDMSLHQKLGKIDSINTPEKIDGDSKAKDAQSTQSIGAIPKANETTMIDTSEMVDDTEDFNMSDFKNNDKGNTIESDTKAETGAQNDKQEEQEQIMEEINEFASNLLEKRMPE